EIVKTPILTKGQVKGLVGVSRDITSKKLFDEELSKSQMILNQAESITYSGSFQYNAEIDLITCSENFSSLMELPNSTNQFSLKKLTMLVYSADRELFIESLERAIESHEEFDMEFRYVTTSSTMRYARMKLSPDWSTDIPLFYGMIVDITSDRLNDLALQKAEENERKKIAMELHDNIGQKLSAAKMYLDQVRKQESGQKVFQIIYELVHESVSDTRNISRELSTQLIEENGLKEAINQLLNRLPPEINIDAEINIENTTIDGFVGGNIFRIIQEAINNTLKYADASSMTLQLYQNSEFLELILKDDGVGFDLQKQIRHGNGLKNIQQRVKTCNGLLKMESNPGLGTTILIKIPPK
ncbi:MAG: PAS domain-containing sensor histidine kinase, partial [Marinoscillum sp.]